MEDFPRVLPFHLNSSSSYCKGNPPHPNQTSASIVCTEPKTFPNQVNPRIWSSWAQSSLRMKLSPWLASLLPAWLRSAASGYSRSPVGRLSSRLFYQGNVSLLPLLMSARSSFPQQIASFLQTDLLKP